jgi:hypothetical protein
VFTEDECLRLTERSYEMRMQDYKIITTTIDVMKHNDNDNYPLEVEFVELFLVQNDFESGNISRDRFTKWVKEKIVIQVPGIPELTKDQVKELLKDANLDYDEFSYFLKSMNEMDIERLRETKRRKM